MKLMEIHGFLRYANRAAKDWAAKDGIKAPEVKIGVMPSRINGSSDGGVIKINIWSLLPRPISDNMRTLRHEYRHIWQWQHKEYAEAIAWWRKHLKLRERYYWAPVCAHEYDARLWAHDGIGDIQILRAYSASRLEMLYQWGVL